MIGQNELATLESRSAVGRLLRSQTTNSGGQRICCGASVTSFSVPFSKLRGTIAPAFYKSASGPQAKLITISSLQNPTKRGACAAAVHAIGGGWGRQPIADVVIPSMSAHDDLGIKNEFHAESLPLRFETQTGPDLTMATASQARDVVFGPPSSALSPGSQRQASRW